MLALLIAALAPVHLPASDILDTDLSSPLRDVYADAARVLPTAVYPRSRESLHRLIEQAPATAQAGAEASAAAIADRLGFAEGTLRLALDLDLQPEAYADAARANLGFAEQLDREEPLLRFHTSYGVDGGPQLVTQTALQREYEVNLPTNIPLPAAGNPAPFENNFIYTGYIHVPGEYLETTFGRQQIHFGPSPQSSLMASDRLPYLDAARLSLTLGRLRMTHLVSTVENRPSDEEIDAGMPDAIGAGVQDNGDQYAYGKNIIFYNVHYFEYAWDRLRAGIGAQMLVSRPMNQFQLGDFFPVFSWHNADIVPNNMCMIVDVSYAVAPGLAVFLQAGWDDVSAETFGIADREIPTIPGYIAGLRYRRETQGPLVSGLLEAGYTHYLWGNFHEEYLLSRAIYRQDTDDRSQSMPLTSPYGPGVMWGRIDANAAWASGVDVGLSYLLRVENTRANLYDTPYRSSQRVENAPREWFHRIGLELGYGRDESFGIRAEPALILDNGEPGFEGSIGVAWRFSHLWRSSSR